MPLYYRRYDTDRDTHDAGQAVTRHDDSIDDREPQNLHDVAQEMLAVLIGLETDQVEGQHRLDQLAMMRHAADRGARRPRRMEEEADRLRYPEVAQFGAKRQEVIILDPEHGVWLLESQQRTRHEGVHFAVGGIILLRSTDQIG